MDRRYLIRKKDSQDTPQQYIVSKCQWNTTYSLTPPDLECVLSYCDNATVEPNTNGLNYNFTNPYTLKEIGLFFTYFCKDNYRIEEDVENKYNASDKSFAKCETDGMFKYPDPWPQCSETVSCPDPGNSSEVTRTYISGSGLQYDSTFEYRCDDPRKWIKHDGEVDALLVATKHNRCQWRQSFPLDGTTFVCVIHHCRHPHDDPGNHPPPGPEYNISLVNRADWDVSFTDSVTYRCDTNTFIENDGIDKNDFEIQVDCIDFVGEYDTPVKQGKSWPNCTETVLCGQPPEPPVNGTITWLSPAVDMQETYDTEVEYKCQNGSQFDTDEDGFGDAISIVIRCQWNKQWAPYPVLPECKITHCVEPFTIPEESFIQEVTDAWTEVKTNKEYECKGKIGNDHTRFWESDRTRSTFQIYCREDGYFTWEDWPTCLEGANEKKLFDLYFLFQIFPAVQIPH